MALFRRAEDGAGIGQGVFGLPGFASANPANRGDAPAKSLKLGELFCGAGGMALGASMASYGGWSYEHAWATDIDRDSCKTIEQVVDADGGAQPSLSFLTPISSLLTPPSVPRRRPVLERLRDVGGGDGVFAREVGYRSRQF